ncbi:uncharacterized protein LOC116162766 [Photinus pyralis]|uniref:uncharacterized protein LOC116162766 n=1 Tax=Photinus pyralis TaxID=7054 RepID=UPI001267453A|nr:uncharacterized protein LOC116162766 [Photinus pyralis]
MSQKSTENTQQEQNEDVECVYDGDVAGVSELDLEVFSPTSIESTSRSRTPSRGESRTPLTIEGRIGTKRKRHRETGDKETDNKGITETKTLLNTAVNAMQEFVGPGVQELRQSKKHTVFGEFIADEMESLKDQDIIDDLKQNILHSIFAAKRQDRAQLL